MVQTATAYSYRRRDLMRKHRVVFMAMPLVSGDLAAVFPTGLKKIYSYSLSPPSLAAKYVTAGTVSGGTITLSLTDPANPAVLYLTAYGL